MLAVHGTDQRDVVDALGQVRQQLGDLHAALAGALELVGRGKQRAGVLAVRKMAKLSSLLGAVPARLCQRRLGIEQVHLAGAAVHEQMNDGFGLGRELRLLRRQIVNMRRAILFRKGGIGREKISPDQRGKRRAVQPVHQARKEIASCVFRHRMLLYRIANQ